MNTTTLPGALGPLRTFLTSGSLASVLVFGNMAVEAAEKEKDAAWVKDVTKAEVPETPAKGKIAGREFTVEKATIRRGILELRQGEDFFADLSFQIFTFVHDDAKLPGTKIHFDVAPLGSAPHIHMKYKEAGKNLPKTEMAMKGYSMTLEFGKPTDEGLPGKIYLCMQDEKKSFVAGTFVAVKK